MSRRKALHVTLHPSLHTCSVLQEMQCPAGSAMTLTVLEIWRMMYILAYMHILGARSSICYSLIKITLYWDASCTKSKLEPTALHNTVQHMVKIIYISLIIYKTQHKSSFRGSRRDDL